MSYEKCKLSFQSNSENKNFESLQDNVKFLQKELATETI